MSHDANREEREQADKARRYAETMKVVDQQIAEKQHTRHMAVQQKQAYERKRLEQLKDLEMESQQLAAQQAAKKTQQRQMCLQDAEECRERRAAQRKREREADIAFVQEVLAREKAEDSRGGQAKSNYQKDVAAYSEYVNALKREERQMEEQLDRQIQQDSAAEWDKREARWTREREAREKLLRSVLDIREAQKQTKSNRRAAEEAERIQEGVELKRRIARLNEQDDSSAANKKANQSKVLLGQIQDRKNKIMAEKMQALADSEAELAKLALYEKRVSKEISNEKTRAVKEAGKETRYPRTSANWMTQ